MVSKGSELASPAVRRRLPTVRARAFLVLAQLSFGACVLNVISGASVRLTDSGLGCADWPACDKTRFTPPASFHPLMEFGNRMIVGVLVALVIVTLLAAVLRTQRRRDLVWLSAGLVLGVIGEALIGAVVVYSKLNPYVVMVHFMVGMLLVTCSFVLALRAGRAPVTGTTKVSAGARRVTWAMVAILAVAIAAGTATTGAGPHAGSPGAKRIPVPLDDMARTHSSIVLVLGALLLYELWLLYKQAAPESIRQRAQTLLAVMVGQGLVGYTQFFTHEPALLVGIHVTGAVCVLVTMLWFWDGLSHHPADEIPGRASPGAPASPAGVSTKPPGLVEVIR